MNRFDPYSILNTQIQSTNGQQYKIFELRALQIHIAMYEGVNQLTNEAVAIIHQSYVSNEEREVITLFLNHKFDNVINIIDFFPAPNNYTFIVIEFHRESLDLYIIKNFENKRVPVQEVLKMMKQISQGIKELHDMNLVSKNLKIDNIAVQNKDSENQYKLTHIGLFKQLVPLDRPIRVSIPYRRAPEYLNQDLNALKSNDIWTMGCIWYQLYKGDYFFQGTNNKMNKTSVTNDISNWTQVQINEQVQSLSELGIADQYIRCLKSMLNRDNQNRPNIDQVISQFEIRIRILNQPPKSSADQQKLQEEKKIQEEMNLQEKGCNEVKEQFEEQLKQRKLEFEITKQDIEQQFMESLRKEKEQMEQKFEHKLEQVNAFEQAKIQRIQQDLITQKTLNLDLERELKYYQQLQGKKEENFSQVYGDSKSLLQTALEAQPELQQLAGLKQKEADELQSLSTQGQNVELSAKIASLIAENTDLQFQNQKLVNQMKEIQDKANDLQQKSDQYYTSFKQKQQECAQCMESIVQRNQSNQELRDKIKEMEEQLTIRLGEMDEIKIQHQIEIGQLREHFEEQCMPQQQNIEQSVPAAEQQLKWITKNRTLISDRVISEQLVKIIKSGKKDQFSEIEGPLQEYFDKIYEENIRVLFLR